MSARTDLTAVARERFGIDWGDPPLGETAVAAFEAEHQVVLPEPYRTFVLDVANGARASIRRAALTGTDRGPPAYGLVGLGEPADPNGYHHIRPGALRRPFPLSEAWLWDDPDASPLTEEDQRRVEDVHQFGSLALGTDGCGMDYVLIVSGDMRGQVWLLTGEGAMPVAGDFGAWLAGDVFPEADWTTNGR